MANGSSDDEKKKMMNDPKEGEIEEEAIKSPKLTIVIPKFELEEDDELEEFKTPTGPKFAIPPPVCPPAPKRKRKLKPETPKMVFFQVPLSEEVVRFFESLYEKLARANKKQKSY